MSATAFGRTASRKGRLGQVGPYPRQRPALLGHLRFPPAFLHCGRPNAAWLRQVRIPRPARIAAGAPAAAVGKLAQHVRQARVGAEPLDQRGALVLARPAADVARNADGLTRVGAEGDGLAHP